MHHIGLRGWLLTGVCLVSMLGTIQAVCHKPTPGANMILSDADIAHGDEYAVGETASFQCDFGYVRSGGSPKVTCQEDNQWSATSLRCQKKTCGAMDEIINGNIDYAGTEHGDTATFSCNKGYILVGRTETTTCVNGQWQGNPPFCEVVTCPKPPTITDGELTTPMAEEYQYGNVVQYQCSRGLTLVGEQTLSCGEDGAWAPAPPGCKKVQCPAPVVENGERIDGRPPYGHKSFVTFKCKDGFDMVGLASLTCGTDNNWNPLPPTCKGRVNPTVDPNGGPEHGGHGWKIALVLSVVVLVQYNLL